MISGSPPAGLKFNIKGLSFVVCRLLVFHMCVHVHTQACMCMCTHKHACAQNLFYTYITAEESCSNHWQLTNPTTPHHRSVPCDAASPRNSLHSRRRRRERAANRCYGNTGGREKVHSSCFKRKAFSRLWTSDFCLQCVYEPSREKSNLTPECSISSFPWKCSPLAKL